METIGFVTGAEGDAASGIGGTDSDEDIDKVEGFDVIVDELELKPETELCDRSVVVPVEVLVSVPVDVPTFPYL